MGYTLLAVVSLVGLFFGMLALLEVGRWIGMRRLKEDAEGAGAGLGPIVGVVFSLLGLLIAFTFSGAASRFDARRQLVVQEANAIEKAYYLTSLLPDTGRQAVLKESFRKYLDAQLEAVRKLPDIGAAEDAISRALMSQREIQRQTLAAYEDPVCKPAAAVLLPAVTQWVDISTARETGAKTHPPVIIFATLVGLALVCSLIAGYGITEAKRRSWLHIIAFALVVTVTIYVTIDLEFPRAGLIRLDAADQLLRELRQSMK